MSSFFTSFLSSIDDKSTSTPNKSAAAPQQPKDTSARNGSDPKVSNTVAGAKRKAEGNTGEERPKIVKKPESTLTAGLSKPQTSTVPVPGGYQGTSRGLPKPAPARPASSDAPKRPTPSSKVSAKPKTLAPVAKASPAVSSPATPSSQPKKNSFKEILARAQGQPSTTSTGVITHKRVEQPTKLSKKAQAEEAKKKQAQPQAGPAKERKAVENPSARSAKSGKSSMAEQKKKSVQVQYKGTMRAPVEYKGTVRAGNSSKPNAGPYRGSAASKAQNRSDRYESYSDEDIEEEEGEEEDYGSDGSSDMEAGAFDVDQEEELSLRQARREDLEAQQQEEEHKRKKLERKNKLAALAANARPRY